MTTNLLISHVEQIAREAWQRFECEQGDRATTSDGSNGRVAAMVDRRRGGALAGTELGRRVGAVRTMFAAPARHVEEENHG